MASTQVEGSGKSNTRRRKNEVGGFLVDKIDGKTMRAYVKDNDLGKKIDLDVTDEQLAVALVLYFKANVPKEDQVRCDVCEGVSSATEEHCPLCGDMGDVEPGEEGEDEGVELSDRSDNDDEPDTAEELEADAAAVREVLAEEEEPGEEPEEAVAAEPPPPTSKKTKKKGDKKEDAMTTAEVVNGHGATGSKKKSTALVSAKDLDTAVGEVRTLKVKYLESTLDGAQAYWEMGKKLLDINAKQLYKLRVDDKGKAKYQSWDTFVRSELGMSPQQAYAAIDCAKNYESPSLIREIGLTKALMLLKAAPEDRPALEEQAKAGASVRQLGAGVKESRKKHGSPKKNVRQAKAGQKGAEKTNKAASARSEKVSVTSFEGVRTVKLHKRPESLRNVDINALPRAKKLGDHPLGKVELANGLYQLITVVADKDGNLVAKIETRREDG